MSGRIPVRLVLPLIALVLVGAVSFVPEPDPPVVAGGSSRVDVRQTVWACQVAPGWTVAAGQVSPGTEAAARPIPPEAAADPVWAQADRWRTAEPGGEAFVLEQSGAGSGSVGYVAGTSSGDAVLGSCPPVVDEAWFVGLGDTGRSEATVTLINLGENRAVADLTWWGADGPIQSLDTSGLVVEPGERREISVDDVAAGEGAVAAHVSRRRGSLTAVALDAGRAGADLVSPASGAARSQVLAGIPRGGTTRVELANPGTSTAHVTVAVRGPQGSFAAQGLEDVSVEPESTRVVTVPGAVDLDQASLAVTSDLPVVASATVETDDDIARVAPAPPITGPAVVPVRMDGRAVRLVLTAEEPAEVVVESFSASMESLGERRVSLEAGASTTVGAPEGKPAYLLVTPVDGAEIRAGLWQVDGERIAAATVHQAPVSVVAPGVSVR
ncbi:hypothetical protein H9L21_12410 [Aeromicrobium senzhongii]|uniref:Secreted protein n=1 Tax=Aeromicrobium senzhongii TaxID=2663859 RepID=A0ABX6SR87_9ACTN|nr:DUF5719 family protein [Aeromicrobium senzhongii]MTB88819.1 hypothetical protein [Aeromicrobium senzhongii]QNL93893.1 hypothetical protein H9L21_12410 [Aeromicrobium senzhongii]